MDWTDVVKTDVLQFRITYAFPVILLPRYSAQALYQFDNLSCVLVLLRTDVFYASKHKRCGKISSKLELGRNYKSVPFAQGMKETFKITH